MNKRKGKKLDEKAPKPPTQLVVGETKEARGTPGRPASRALFEKERSMRGVMDHSDTNHLVTLDRYVVTESFCLPRFF